MAVACRDQLLAQRLRMQRLPLPEEKRAGGEIFDGGEAVERRRDGHDRHIELALHELVERGEALGDQVVMRCGESWS